DIYGLVSVIVGMTGIVFYTSDIFRIFCFFDHGQLVVLTNGFQKKTQKTPKQEIEKALKIKKEYENEKK
nr:type II toxin-antitoxin system RelE/ParE family toxin [Bacteroidota bacterium]